MKIRNGFISNSSSSSFVIAKSTLTDEQIEKIHDWKTEGIHLVTKCPCFKDREFNEETCFKICYSGDKASYEEYRARVKKAEDEGKPLRDLNGDIESYKNFPEFDSWSPFKFPYCWEHGGGWGVINKESPYSFREDPVMLSGKYYSWEDEKGFLVVSGWCGGNFPMRDFLAEIGVSEYRTVHDNSLGRFIPVKEKEK